MSGLPYCDICNKQIVNASAIGWYCPTVGCEGDWPQKANIVFDYKTDAKIIEEQQATINTLCDALDGFRRGYPEYTERQLKDLIEQHKRG